MDRVELHVIATVSNNRDHLENDNWGAVVSQITLSEELSSDLFIGLDAFSHVEILFLFHRQNLEQKVSPTRHPRSNPDWPKIGLLAQRSSYHPNPVGFTSAKILGVKGRVLTVQGLDAVNGTPILDIKPVFREFTPAEIEQPQWVSELMKNYWS